MKLLVLDGNSILNRAFYGIKLLSTKNGDFTNGIYGFLTMLKKLLDENEPQAVAVAFDMRAPTFRHKRYAGYKANRHGMPEELAQQHITPATIRLSVGVEHIDDIIADLEQAFNAIK